MPKGRRKERRQEHSTSARGTADSVSVLVRTCSRLEMISSPDGWNAWLTYTNWERDKRASGCNEKHSAEKRALARGERTHEGVARLQLECFPQPLDDVVAAVRSQDLDHRHLELRGAAGRLEEHRHCCVCTHAQRVSEHIEHTSCEAYPHENTSSHASVRVQPTRRLLSELAPSFPRYAVYRLWQ